MSYTRAADLASLWPGEMIGVVVDGTRVLLVNVDGRVCAYEDRCAHQLVPLSEGKLAGSTLTCRAHGWQYDATNGHGLNPVTARLRRFPVRVERDQILVSTSDDPR
jgi:toluene monooxygenase system ferredoxin subunit